MESGFVNTIVETTIHLLPSRLSNIQKGVYSIVSQMVMRFHPQLGGILLSYDKVEILEDTAQIFENRPHIHFRIRFRALLFQPKVNAYVVGTVNSISDADHIGLLVHGLFNAVLLTSKDLPAGYEFDKENNAWVNGETQEQIAVGTKIRMRIHRITHHAGLVSLNCTMAEDMTGIVS